jgi:hypothetical protein
MAIPRKKAPDADKPYNGGTWTTARFNGFVKSTLRSGSQRWPPKYKALGQAKQGKRINPATGRLAEHYRCAACKGDFPAKNIQVDHISPVIDPNTGFTTWDDVIKRMFCEEDNFQILCRECHKEKTNSEKQQSLERTNADKLSSGNPRGSSGSKRQSKPRASAIPSGSRAKRSVSKGSKAIRTKD